MDPEETMVYKVIGRRLAHLDKCVKNAQGKQEVWGTAPVHECRCLIHKHAVAVVVKPAQLGGAAQKLNQRGDHKVLQYVAVAAPSKLAHGCVFVELYRFQTMAMADTS